MCVYSDVFLKQIHISREENDSSNEANFFVVVVDSHIFRGHSTRTHSDESYTYPIFKAPSSYLKMKCVHKFEVKFQKNTNRLNAIQKL